MSLNTIAKTISILFYFIFLSIFLGCSENKNKISLDVPINNSNLVKSIGFKVTGVFPHDTTSFTEGLFFFNNQLYESTGAPMELNETRSLFGVLNLKTGIIDIKAELDKQIYFGEGIALLNGKIYQLTYKNRIGFVYNSISYKKIDQFSFDNKEGWGLTTDGKSLIMSDGTDTITYISPRNFSVEKKIIVSENNVPVNNINELEFVNGSLYANVFTTNFIIKIDTVNGKVIGKIDFEEIKKDALMKNPNALEMNGIAFDPAKKLYYVTGKMWPTIYQIALNE